MIRFPVFHSLTLENYGLYPDSYKAPLEFDFLAGPNLVVGVNGSGKTTFINISLRCITGSFDLPAATSEHELGNVKSKVISYPQRAKIFAQRVADGAAKATATLKFALGDQIFEVTRSLKDLKLINVKINGHPFELPLKNNQEKTYQAEIAGGFFVNDFFDVLIILRYLTFMMEDRRALVWDTTAQREIFRVLALPAPRAHEYALARQAIGSADSKYRNTKSSISRLKKSKTEAEKRAGKVVATEAERRLKVTESNAVIDKLSEVSKTRVSLNASRGKIRLQRIKSIEARDHSLRDLERTKIESLRHWLSPSQDNITYIISNIIAKGKCLVCDTQPSPVAATISKRLNDGLCPICGSTHKGDDEKLVTTEQLDVKRIKKLEDKIDLATNQISRFDYELQSVQSEFEEVEKEFYKQEKKKIKIDQELVDILQKMPAEKAAIASTGDGLKELEAIAEQDRLNLSKAERRFKKVVTESVLNVQQIQEAIADSFSEYLSLFIKEEAKLLYQPVSAKIGQSAHGSLFEFPAFNLIMTGGAIAGQSLRSSPNQVSQSQAEFVDLAFRMALMSVVANGSGATLVVDAPEASLDFLFAKRAGKQLASFAFANSENRVIITSYLPSQHLVNSFLKEVVKPKSRANRIIDLIKIAASNAAMEADRSKYEDFLAEVVENKVRDE